MSWLVSLCSGYGGLDLAAEAWFDATTLAHFDNDPAAAKVLAAHWPTVPNGGDITRIRWDCLELPEVAVMTAGYPCQPFSHAGRRKGETDERHLWPHVRAAIRGLRPAHVLMENVAGHRTLGLGAVLGDLASAGYHTQWTSLRASDVGAPHGRERVFILASDTDRPRLQGHRRVHPASGEGEASAHDRRPIPDTGERGRQRRRTARERGLHDPAPRSGPPAPHPDNLRRQRLGREPSDGPDPHRRDAVDDPESAVAWGAYEPAVRRWEHVTGRAAPPPTEVGPRGGQRLAARFVEWMMGAEDGWVTGVEGLTRNDHLRLLGNGVITRQATAALDELEILAGLDPPDIRRRGA